MRTLIAIPCMDMVHTQFLKSLMGMNKVGSVGYAISCSSLIYDARNGLAKQAIEEGYDRVLWLDSDMDFAPDMFEKLSADMDEGLEMVGGIYFTRKVPCNPVFYKQVGYYHDSEKDEVTPVAVPYREYPMNTLFEVEGIGFGGVLVDVNLIKRVQDKFGLPFSPILGFGEDLSFCVRARQLDAKIFCDSRIKLGHVGQAIYTENTYLGGLNADKG